MSKTPSSESESSERRSAVRYECDQPASCHLFSTKEDLLARVENISDTGIGLELDRPFIRDTTLVVQLQSPVPAEALTLPARVVHSTSKPDGTYLVGCEFDTKPDIELDSKPERDVK